MNVKKELFKSKTLKNGEHPVIIRLHHQNKAKVLSTGISAKVINWNKEKQVIRSTDKQYKEKNKKINDEYIRINQRITEFDVIDRPYDLELIISNEEITKMYNEYEEEVEEENEKLDNFVEVLDKKITTYKEGSARKYRQLRNFLTETFDNNIPNKNIGKKWFSMFEEKLKPKGVKQAKELIKRFITVYEWGFKEGYIANFKPLNYNKKNYASIIKKRTLDLEGFSYLQSIYYKNINIYIDNFFEKPYTYEKNNYFNALNIYLAIVAFNGLAPIDLATLRIKDLKKKTYNIMPFDYLRTNDKKYVDEWNHNNKLVKYYSIQLLRKKTKKEVDINLPCEIVNEIIYTYFYDDVGFKKKENDFILNVFDKDTFDTLTEKQIYYRMSNYFNTLSSALNKYIRNEENAPNVLKEDKITFYSARHTALNVLSDKGVSMQEISNLAGHDLKTLENSYIGNFNIKRKIENSMKVWNVEKQNIKEEEVEVEREVIESEFTETY